MRSLWLCLLLAPVAFAAAAGEDGVVRFVQDEFGIIVFNDVAEGQDVAAAYRDIAAANFKVVLVGGDQDLMREKMDLCEQLGMSAITLQLNPFDQSGGPSAVLPEHPACWGYAIRDEPGVKDFPDLAPMIDTIHQERPGKLGLINLFPSYAAPWAQLGAEDYETYVRIFMEQCDVDVLSMDHYPHFRPGEPDGRDAYCADLDVMRRHSLKKGIPFWNCFNIMPYGNHTDPTEAQVRWQMHATVAYGGKGLIYFCYVTPNGRGPGGIFEFPKGGAVITAEGRKTRHYAQSKRLNGVLKNLGPTLMKLTSTQVIRVRPEDEPKDVLAGSPIADLGREDYDPRHDCLVGVFRHEDGRRAVFLMNYHFAYTQWPTVIFDAPEGEVREVCQATGAEVALVDESPEQEGMQLSLDAGQGRLFLLPAAN